MPVNDNKPKQPEDIINDVINSFLGAFGDAPKSPKESTVDPVAEVNRLLKKAESSDSVNETAELLQIADRHLKIIELALAYQR